MCSVQTDAGRGFWVADELDAGILQSGLYAFERTRSSWGHPINLFKTPDCRPSYAGAVGKLP